VPRRRQKIIIAVTRAAANKPHVSGSGIVGTEDADAGRRPF
jgi:hypothetical protein